MNDTRRRGTRRRTTGHSLETAPLSGGDEGARPVDSQSSEGDGQQSQGQPGDHDDQTTDKTAETNPGSDESGQPDGTTSQNDHSPYDHTPEESKEWQAMVTETDGLRKGKQHGDKKITQLGQESAGLRQENVTLKQQNTDLMDRVGRLESAVGQVNARNGAGQDQDATADLGGDFDFENTDEERQQGGNQDGDLRQAMKTMQQVVGKVYNQNTQTATAFQEWQQQQAKEDSVSGLESQFGVNREAAEVLMSAFESGDMVKFGKAFELATVPAQARQQAREHRDLQRDAVFMPARTGGTPYAPAVGDEAALKKEAETVADMPDGRPKQRATEKFLNSHPDAANHLATATGWNV